ncbi:MAG TPA: Hint domain-containing protein [Candidatus Limnocylindrales bacterium]|nr:Hint domain-containing protein [Candidatus Limnocylindrales bacterium]
MRSDDREPRTQLVRRAAVKRATVIVAALIAVALAAGCGAAASPEPSASSAPSVSPGPALSPIDLKAALVDALGPLWYCDPDSYPVGRDELAAMQERWSEVTADVAAFATIAERVGVDPTAELTDEERLEIYREWKMLNAVAFEPQGPNDYRFDYLAQPAPGAAEGRRVVGVIAADGRIEPEQDTPAGEPMCPICLVRGTRIATPAGDVAVEDVRPGMSVWTMDGRGRRVVATVIGTGRVAVGASHVAIRVGLADGRSLTASAGHPLADGRAVGSLAVGDVVDGAVVTSLASVANVDGWTFDLLPSGDTGAYWADEVLVGSTLAGLDDARTPVRTPLEQVLSHQ